MYVNFYVFSRVFRDFQASRTFVKRVETAQSSPSSPSSLTYSSRWSGRSGVSVYMQLPAGYCVLQISRKIIIFDNFLPSNATFDLENESGASRDLQNEPLDSVFQPLGIHFGGFRRGRGRPSGISEIWFSSKLKSFCFFVLKIRSG